MRLLIQTFSNSFALCDFSFTVLIWLSLSRSFVTPIPNVFFSSLNSLHFLCWRKKGRELILCFVFILDDEGIEG